jgi:hypothetical protein
LAVYDLKEKCPNLDRYWEHAKMVSTEDCLNEDQPLLEFYGRESSQAMPGEVILQDPFTREEEKRYEQALKDAEAEAKKKQEVRVQPAKKPAAAAQEKPAFIRRLTTMFKRGGNAEAKPAASNQPVTEPENERQKLVVFDTDQEIALINNLPMTLELKTLAAKPLNIVVSGDETSNHELRPILTQKNALQVLDITKELSKVAITPMAFKRTKFDFSTDHKELSMKEQLEEDEEEYKDEYKSKTIYSKTRNHQRQMTFNFKEEAQEETKGEPETMPNETTYPE